MLSCNNLSISFSNKILFKSFGLTVFPGSLVLLRGKNGSGKSCLLKIISGLLAPDQGFIELDGLDIKDDISYYHNLISYLGHQNALKEQLSVIENIIFWSELSDTPELIPAAISYFKLNNIADVKCSKLSAGWKKRVALARLLTSNTKIWLLDEPEVNLDEEGRNLLLNLVSSRIEQKGIVIIASHNLPASKNIIEVNLEDFS